MRDFLTALQFLTIFPLSSSKGIKEEDLGKSLLYFPLVGMLLGVLLVFTQLFFSLFFPRTLVDGWLVLALVVFSGGLHLDGLGDTLDALAGGYSREERLRIMKDHHLGAMGVSGIVLILLLKYLSLNSLPSDLKTSALLVMPTLSRWSLVPLCFFSPYARKEKGWGFPFVNYGGKRELVISTLLAFVLLFFLFRFAGILIMALITLFTWGLGSFFKRRLGGITGDGLGAANELNELLVLMLLLIISRG